MRYLGGKALISKWVASNVWALRAGRTKYLEPFVGSGAVFKLLAPHFASATAADAHPDLIMMWKAIAEGWKPPARVTKEEWVALKEAEPSALRGFVGFGCSFGGMFFSSYAERGASGWKNGRENRVPQHEAKMASRMKPVFSLPHVELRCADYAFHRPDADTVVYCDPPYAGTAGYSTGSFDSSAFWNTAASWTAAGALVVVSEYTAPSGWVEVAAIERRTIVGAALHHEKGNMRTERLFVRAT